MSAFDQDPRLQHDALEHAGAVRVYTDRTSGSRADRPALGELLAQLSAGDTLVVWRLDRLARSIRHLIEVGELLAERGVHLVSLTEAIDTSTPAGRLMFHLLAAIGEFERELIRERTQAGLVAARARGRSGGRPTVMTPTKLEAMRRLHEAGHTYDEIAHTLGVGRATIGRHLSTSGRRSS